MTDKIFVDGLSIKSTATQYGEIIKLGINFEKFTEFLAKYVNERGYINIDLKQGKSGKRYGELNTYQSNPTNDSEDEPIMEFDNTDEVPF